MNELALLFGCLVMALLEGANMALILLFAWPFALRDWVKKKMNPPPQRRGTQRPLRPV